MKLPACVPSSRKINAAVRDWLDQLQPGGSPLAHLAAQIEKLKQDQDWSADEISSFESTARRMLIRLMNSQDSSGDTNA
jgi:hypothetical protein